MLKRVLYGTLLCLLSFQLITGHTLIGELIKAPFLMEHYTRFRSCYPDASMLDFLQIHYQNSLHARSDANHQQLPFMQLEHFTVLSELPAAPQMPVLRHLPPWQCPCLLFDCEGRELAGYNRALIQPPDSGRC